MAYSALVSLKTTLRKTMSTYSADGCSILNCEKHEVESFLGNLDFLQHQFLEENPPNPSRRNETTACLEERIRDAVYEAQDILDIHQILHPHFISNEPIKEEEKDREYVAKLKKSNLKTVFREIDSIKQEVHLIINKAESLTVKLPDDAPPRPWNSLRAKFGSDSNNVMLGLDDLRLRIKDKLSGESSSSLQVISVVGMGGIGKTTLAIHTCNDPYIMAHFDIRGWVTVSQSYCKRNMLLDLLDSTKQLTPEMRRESDDELECHLHKCLKVKRYFMVIDDIWDTDAWNCVRRMFPNDCNGSRIMLTTRITDLAAYATTSSDNIYQMPLLSDDSSWILFRAKILGSESDRPLDFEEIGKDIARKCGGLPLSIVVMAGLLSKVDKTHEAWQAVAASLETSLLSSSNDLISSEILKMSYDYLPQHLKSCFLYIGIFPEDHEIEVTKLVNLWIAEGFLDGFSCESSVEETGEILLGELIDRSLLSMSKMKPNGKMKSCRIHDLLLDLCVKESMSEKILQVTKWDDHNHLFSEHSTGQRRLSVHQKGGSHYIKPPTSSSLLRSLICNGVCRFAPNVFVRFKLLRVLDLIQIAFDKFPEKVTQLVQLRYLAFLYRGIVPSSISKLCYLQTLIINASLSRIFKSFKDLYLPSEIWRMKHLRHIRFGVTDLKLDDEIDLVLEELQTIEGIWELRFTKELVRRIPNVRKLSVSYQYFESSWHEFENLGNLKELKINIKNGGRFHKGSDFGFPKSMKTLSLSGCRIPWEDLSRIVGSLPCLEVLKLKANACVGKVWEPKEGDFCELKVLELFKLDLNQWNSEPNHFPRLEHLIVHFCTSLEKIPVEWGESCTLNKIELGYLLHHNITASVDEIKSIQYDFGNEDFQVVGPNY